MNLKNVAAALSNNHTNERTDTMLTKLQKPLYAAIATAIGALARCKASNNTEWVDRWTDELKQAENKLPSGSGFDSGTTLDLDASTSEKLVFRTSFHHMDENGCYDGWTEHTITVRPSLEFGFNLTISGRNRNDIKSYMAEQFGYILRESAAE
jgi:hypothetical protein